MRKKLSKKITRVLSETKEQLQSIYSRQLREIILFGSYARGDYSKGSDIDLLLLLDHLDNPGAERDRYMAIICDLSLKYDMVVSIITMDYATYHTQKTPLILNVQKEGVRL
jgi:predicted nucleotidyltransferase